MSVYEWIYMYIGVCVYTYRYVYVCIYVSAAIT